MFRAGKGAFSVLLAISALIATTSPSISASPPKAGATCVKQGTTKNYQGKTYTCVKSGKTLIWNKGEVVKKTTPTSTSTPTPAPTPTPTPSPTPTSTPTQFIPPRDKPNSIKDLDPATAWYFAWESMEKIRKESRPYIPKFNYVKSVNFSNEKLEVIQEGLNEGARFWSSFWKYEGEISVILGTEQDQEFWERELKPFYDSRYHKTRDELYRNILNDFSRNGGNNNSAGASWFSNKPNINFPYGTKVTAEEIRLNLWQTSPHEFTHIVQGTMGYAFNLYGSGEIWMGEGQAEHTGLFLSKSSPLEYLEYRNLRFRNQWRDFEQRNLVTPEQIYSALNSKSNTLIYSAVYSYGAAAWEALVAIHGQEAVLNYFKKIQSGIWWPNAFKEVFGMSEDDFLREISIYLSNLRKFLLP